MLIYRSWLDISDVILIFCYQCLYLLDLCVGTLCVVKSCSSLGYVLLRAYWQRSAYSLWLLESDTLQSKVFQKLKLKYVPTSSGCISGLSYCVAKCTAITCLLCDPWFFIQLHQLVFFFFFWFSVKGYILNLQCHEDVLR